MNIWRLRRKLHRSWLIATASAGVAGGVIAAQYVPQGWFASWVWLIVAVGLLAVGLWSRWTVTLAGMVIAGGLLGLWRGAAYDEQLRPYVALIGQSVTLRGHVKEDVDRDRHGALVVRCDVVVMEGHPLPGVVQLTTSSEADIKRGDIVEARGQISEGFGGIAATIYRAELVHVQRPEPGDVARQVRDGFADKVRLAVDEPAVSLGLGYLLGQRRGLPNELSQALQAAGLTHIVVASGYNLTILVRIARRLFVKVSKYLATLAASAMTLGFMAVTGMSPSMARAGLVTGLALLAWYYGRKFHPLVLLPFAAAVTLFVQPSYGWGDLGWQLSFAAFAGVMIVAPLGQRYFFGEAKPGLLRQILGETVAAYIVTLPILLLAFGQVSVVAIVANILVLPLVPLAMLLTFLTGLAVMAIPTLGMIIGQGLEGLLNYMIWVAETLAGLPWAQLAVPLPLWVAIVAYGLLAVACVYAWRVTRYALRDANLVE